jgi:hypothetical protein
VNKSVIQLMGLIQVHGHYCNCLEVTHAISQTVAVQKVSFTVLPLERHRESINRGALCIIRCRRTPARGFKEQVTQIRLSSRLQAGAAISEKYSGK